MFGVIYKITNAMNGKVYVGQTTRTTANRWAVHQSDARRRPKTHFHKAIVKYGAGAFWVEVLEECDSYERLNEREHVWILALRSFEPSLGYNGTMGGENGERTPETRAKLSVALKGRKQSPEQRQKASEARKGIPHSEAHRANLAAANKKRTGQKRPAHVGAAVAKANKERRLTSAMLEALAAGRKRARNG